ncbi:MAG: PVC-type heme-binding CxxCH protein [Verrucomicrobiota bacterium]
MRIFPCVLLSLTFTTPIWAQRDLKELPPVDAAAEKASFELAPGLEINLFAQEPMIAKPIQMSWDEKGRLWVASSAIYPQIKPGQEQADRILVVEDTNGDGVADKSTVFYEGLLIPTGIMPGDGGAYIANSTELLFMKDTDGDGRADETKVLLSGFGTEDTHHILHSIKRGPDGNVYFAQSVYIHSHIETPFGPRRLMGSGWWQFRPETGKLEVFSMGQVNPWGMVWDTWGRTFTTDGAYGEGINFTFPGATFLCLPNQLPRILKGLNPGQPKQSGLERISGRHFPDEMQGQLITNDFRGHRVNRFALKEEGSGFSSQQLPDLVRSTHGSFRPVDVRIGPDGALYLADWYNPIIQHGEVDFHDPRRDREHGRIWRVTAKGRPVVTQLNYEKLSVAELLDHLNDPEDWVRINVKQELKRRKVENLDKMAIDRAFGPGATPEVASEVIGLLQTTQQMAANNPLLNTALGDDFLMNAVRASGQLFLDGKPGNLDLLLRCISSDAAKVRLEAVNALRRMGTAQAAEAATLALGKAMDENIDFAVWLTCRELAGVWLPAFQKGEITFDGDVARISFALKAADRPEAMGALLSLVKEGKIPAPKIREALGLVGSLGSPADLAQLLSMASAPDTAPALIVAAYDALGTASKQRKAKPAAGTEALLEKLKSGDAAVRSAAVRLAGTWKLETARPALEELARGGSAEALEAVSVLGGADSVKFLTGLAAQTADVSLKANVLGALIALDAPAAAAPAAEFLAGLKDAAPAAAVFDAYLGKKGGPVLLANAIGGKKVDSSVAIAGVRKASASGGETKPLVDALTAAGGLEPVGMGLSPEEMTKVMAEVKISGNAARGEAIYRRQAYLCQTCHAIGAVGGIVGPDLLSIGSSAPVDYIVDSLLEPSKKIKEGYATTLVNTKDGGVFSGFLVREDAREVILRDATGVVQSIPAASVATKQSIPVSLMPPALTASLRRDEFIDLVRFLAELGKEGDYKVQADGLIRRWRLAQPTPELSQLINRDGLRALTVADQPGLAWLPAYGTVKGDLPLEDMPVVKLYQISGRVAQGEVSVTTPGKVTLKFADPAGIKAWVGQQEITPAATVTLDLPVGKHSVTLLLDPAARKSPLRVEIEAAPGSETRVVPVGGV